MRTDVLVATAVLAFAAVVDPALPILNPVSVAHAQTRTASTGVTRTGSAADATSLAWGAGARRTRLGGWNGGA